MGPIYELLDKTLGNQKRGNFDGSKRAR
jgi:hypothetical protein